VGVCNGRAFLLWAGLGLDAIIVAQMETHRRGRRRFALAKYLNSLFWNARRWGGMDLTIEADGARREGRYLLAVVSNIRTYAGGMSSLSPQACLDDGEMELWLFSGENMRQSLLHALRLLSGLHVRSSQIACLPFRELQIASDDRLALQLDGEPASLEGPLTVEVRRAALRVLAPESAPARLFRLPPLELGSGFGGMG
jgi:diacylglycerol kinase (ATP)